MQEGPQPSKTAFDAPVSSHGKEWQEFRTAVNQVMLQPRNMVQYVQPIDNVAQDFVSRMRTIRTADGKMPSNFAHELSKCTLECKFNITVCNISLKHTVIPRCKLLSNSAYETILAAFIRDCRATCKQITVVICFRYQFTRESTSEHALIRVCS